MGDLQSLTEKQLQQAIKQFQQIVAERKASQKNTTSRISPPEYECPECRDTGVISFEKENGYRACKRCKCYEWREIKRLRANSGIQAAFSSRTLDNYHAWSKSTQAAKRKAGTYARDFEQLNRQEQSSIAFLGSVGAGKTHLGVGIMQELLNRRIAVVYVPYREMASRLKQNAMDEEAYYRRLGRYTNVRVLFIDDLYKGMTQADVKHVQAVIDARYLSGKATIFTSEHDLDALCNIDDAIGSRIGEMCGLIDLRDAKASSDRIHVFNGDRENYRLRAVQVAKRT